MRFISRYVAICRNYLAIRGSIINANIYENPVMMEQNARQKKNKSKKVEKECRDEQKNRHSEKEKDERGSKA